MVRKFERVGSLSSRGNGRRLAKSNQVLTGTTQTCIACCARERESYITKRALLQFLQVCWSRTQLKCWFSILGRATSSRANIEHRRTWNGRRRDDLQVRHLQQQTCRSGEVFNTNLDNVSLTEGKTVAAFSGLAQDRHTRKHQMPTILILGNSHRDTMDRRADYLRSIARRSAACIVTFTANFRIGFSYPSSIEHQWKSRSYTSSMSGMEIRTSPGSRLLHDILLDMEKNRWANHFFTSSTLDSKISRTDAKHVEDCKVGVEGLIALKFEQDTIRVPHLTVGTLQKDHPQKTDGTQLTPLVNIMTRTTFTQSNVCSFFSEVVDPFLSRMSKRARDSLSLHRLARNKSQFITQ